MHSDQQKLPSVCSSQSLVEGRQDCPLLHSTWFLPILYKTAYLLQKKSENNSRFRLNYHVTNFSQTQFTYTLCIIKLQKMTQILQEPCLVKTLLFNAPLVNPKKIEVYFIIAIDCTLYQLHQYNKNTRDVGKTCKQFVNSSPLACDYKLFKHSPNIQKWFITLLNQQQVHFIAFIEKKLNFHGLTSAISNKVLTNQGSCSISVIL